METMESSIYESALWLATEKNLPIYPLAPNEKGVAIFKEPEKRATTDPQVIYDWWHDPLTGDTRSYNIAIHTGPFYTHEWLLGVDVDKKHNGWDSVMEWELEKGLFLPKTYQQETPSGGGHFIYMSPFPVKNSVRKVAPGIDIRGLGGKLVGAGSLVNGVAYRAIDPLSEVVAAPDWLLELVQQSIPKAKNVISFQEAYFKEGKRRAIEYLATAPPAIEDHGGDQTTYDVCCRVVRDFGVPPKVALDLLLDHWNDRCHPMWNPEELLQKLDNAARYGRNEPGHELAVAQFTEIVEAPEAEEVEEEEEAEPPRPKEPPPDWIAKLNKRYAFVTIGGKACILDETVSPEKKRVVEYLDEKSFHLRFDNERRTLQIGEDKIKNMPDSKWWMMHKARRSYQGICFLPGQKAPPEFFNIWRGFAVEPMGLHEKLPLRCHAAFENLLWHVKTNIVLGNEDHFRWFLGFFAHLVQHPMEKPHVAIVLRGRKGVGKNAFMDRMKDIFGDHYAEIDKASSVLGDFNEGVGNKQCITLTEAFWGGDKAAESALKHLITGEYHYINPKHRAPFEVRNFARVIIMGNENWLVPATRDERRYAVFDVANYMQKRGDFFGPIKNGMRVGGNRLLLRFLMDYDLSGLNYFQAPDTVALLDQILESLRPIEKWLYESLKYGALLGLTNGTVWPAEDSPITRKEARDAFIQYMREQGRCPFFSPETFGKTLREVLDVGDGVARTYWFPDLPEARKLFERYIGYEIPWDRV